MKKTILFISFVFILNVFLNLFSAKNVFADQAECTSNGGTCSGVSSCPTDSEYVQSNNGIMITCSFGNACCKKKEELLSECEKAGGECLSYEPSKSIYSSLAKSCTKSGESCYKKTSVLQNCAAPAKCKQYSCPLNSKQTSGTCTYPGVCCLPDNLTPNETGQNQGELKLWRTIFCDNEKGINTAIGCIPISEPKEFIAWILRWAMGIGGGISFLLIIVASFQIITSSGNPERIQAGKELLTSAIAGLIMLVFSVFILKVIGVDILKLPGLK